ncbi:hypothetical protein ACR6HW_10950 [Fusibacter sp. JL298sf-3]
MRHEVKKICRIVDELTTLFLRDDTNEVDFKIKRTKDSSMITIIDYDTHFNAADIAHLEEMLSGQRQAEIEEYYWQLAGETDEGDELTLVSAMIDEAVVEKKDGNLYVKLVRLNR